MDRLAGRLVASWGRPRPDTLAWLLWPVAAVYGALAGLLRALYRRGWLQAQRAPVPVLVVGNLVAGGAGKTPTVISLLPRLRAMGYTPGVITRGHGRLSGPALLPVCRSSRAADCGDEPLLIHLRTGAPVMVGADRVAAARALCAQHPQIDLLVADDGLQHLRLARDATVLVFDERGVGNGLLLPAGPLRQPLPKVLPPATLVLYTAGQASTPLPGVCGQRRLGTLAPLADWWADLGPPCNANANANANDIADTETNTDDNPNPNPNPNANAPAASDGWSALRTRPVLAVAGLARPEAFFRMLEARGLHITRLPLPDHAALDPLPWPADSPDVVLTEKDAIKLGPRVAGASRVWVARLDFAPEPAFDLALRALCAPFPPRGPSAPLQPARPGAAKPAASATHTPPSPP